MGVYDRQIAAAQRQIKAKGLQITWRNYEDTPGGTNAKPVAHGFTDYTPYAVFIPAGGGAFKTFLSTVNGTEIPVGNEIALLGPLTFEPATRDIIIRGVANEQVQIVDIERIAPNVDEVVLYKVWVAR